MLTIIAANRHDYCDRVDVRAEVVRDGEMFEVDAEFDLHDGRFEEASLECEVQLTEAEYDEIWTAGRRAR